MKEQIKRLFTIPEEPLQHWFLRPWTPVSIGTVAAALTIVFAFRENCELAVSVVISGLSLAFTSWVLRFYQRQLVQRHQLQKNEYKGLLEARESSVREREKEIELFKKHINLQEKRYSQLNEINVRAVVALSHFIEVCRQENAQMLEKYRQFERQTGRKKDFIVEAGIAKQFLQTALARLVQVFQALLPSTVLWAVVRQHQPGKDIYVTDIRFGNFNPARTSCTEPIPEDRSIPKMLRQQYKKDGTGVIITSPGASGYDAVEGDKYRENLSIMAAPILGGKLKVKGQIKTEMPMWIALNSPQANAFHDGLMPYMACCARILSEFVKDWPDIIRVAK